MGLATEGQLSRMHVVAGNPGLPNPSASVSEHGSHASPTVSASRSAWLGLAAAMQLSQKSSRPSASPSGASPELSCASMARLPGTDVIPEIVTSSIHHPSSPGLGFQLKPACQVVYV